MTPETEALIALLEITYLHRMDGLPMRSQYVNPDGPQAVALIREQAAEIERLRDRPQSDCSFATCLRGIDRESLFRPIQNSRCKRSRLRRP